MTLLAGIKNSVRIKENFQNMPNLLRKQLVTEDIYSVRRGR